MNTNEFCKEMDKMAYTTDDGEVIYVYAKDPVDEEGWFLKIDPWLKSTAVNWRWENLNKISPFALQKILNLVAKLKNTPIKDRFSIMMYTVRALADSDSSYLTLFYDSPRYAFRKLYTDDNDWKVQQTFTKRQLRALKRDSGVAIDWDKAIIEPVKNVSLI